jgi:intracellular sulfur oxidation DsrE/DsrF family protein
MDYFGVLARHYYNVAVSVSATGRCARVINCNTIGIWNEYKLKDTWRITFMIRSLGAILMAVTLCLGVATPTFAADKEKKIVLQVSDGSGETQTKVLNIVNNLQEAYGVDNVKIEVVAFNTGLRLLFKDNVNSNRIAALNQNGVRFSACQNTVKGMTKVLGHPPEINKQAVSVPAGIVRIAELTDQGYLLVRP